MPKNKRPKPGEGVPEEIKKSEGLALKKLWDSRKKRTQAKFLAELDLSPGYLPQFFSGERPVYLDLGIALAAELEVDLEDFSARLAKEQEERIQAAEWPFTHFSRSDYKSLTAEQRRSIEQLVVEFLRANGKAPTRRSLRIVKG